MAARNNFGVEADLHSTANLPTFRFFHRASTTASGRPLFGPPTDSASRKQKVRGGSETSPCRSLLSISRSEGIFLKPPVFLNKKLA